MKTIKYFIIAVMVAMTLFSPVMSQKAEKTVFLVKTDTTVPSAALLEQSSVIITERLKGYGLAEPEVKVIPEKGIIKIVLPGKIQAGEIESLLTSKGELAFYETSAGPGGQIVLSGSPVLKGSDLEKISVATDDAGSPKISLRFNDGAAKIWASVTEKNIGKSIAIVIDGKIIYSPVVRQQINGGFCEITGDFTEKEILSMVALISDGPLPVTFSIIK